MSDTSSETPRSAPPLDFKQIKEDSAKSASGEKRQKLNTQIQADYARLLSIKMRSPERWQTFLSLVRAEQEASKQHQRHYRESTRQAWLKAHEAVEYHTINRMVMKLDKSYLDLKGTIHDAKELGKAYEEIPLGFQRAVEGLINEGYTGYPVSSEEKTAA